MKNDASTFRKTSWRCSDCGQRWGYDTIEAASIDLFHKCIGCLFSSEGLDLPKVAMIEKVATKRGVYAPVPIPHREDTNMANVKTNVYLPLVPTFGKRYIDGEHKTVVTKVRVTSTTVGPPKSREESSVVIKLKMNINQKVFMPYEPVAELLIDTDNVLSDDVLEVTLLDDDDNEMC